MPETQPNLKKTNPGPLVSIIILNYNGAPLLAECIDSVKNTTYSPIEIIVVDNNSSDESCRVLENYPEISLIRNDQNYGYAKGNNIGVSECSGKYAVILNNDVSVESTWLDSPVNHLESHPETALVCCRQMSYYQRDIIDGLYHTIQPDLTFFPFGQSHHLSDDPRYLQSGFVIGANGASLIVRKNIFTELGGLDERFFAYQEETDLNIRAFLSGWKCYYCADAVVYHKGSMSFNEIKPMVYYFRERNRIWLLYKNFPILFIIKYLHLNILLELRVVRVFFLKLRRPDLYFKARGDALKELKHYKMEHRLNVKKFRCRQAEFLYFKKHLFKT